MLQLALAPPQGSLLVHHPPALALLLCNIQDEFPDRYPMVRWVVLFGAICPSTFAGG